jgi:hypothetical protein
VTEKSESEILVNGSILARVYQEPQSSIARRGVATALNLALWPGFIKQFQCDRRRLKLPQGASGYTGHNEGKRGENRELAVPYSGAPGLMNG